MSVTDRVRQIELEIDAGIRHLPIWQGFRAGGLADVVRTYRDLIEVAFIKLLDAETFRGSSEDFGAAFDLENRVRAGSLWALKWASQYCPEAGTLTSRTP